MGERDELVEERVDLQPMSQFTDAFVKLEVSSIQVKGLGKFFGLHSGNLRKDVVMALLGKLRRIERWFQVQRTFAFYASSLLIVYSSCQDCSPDSSDPSHDFSASSVPADGCQSVDPVPASGIPQSSPPGETSVDGKLENNLQVEEIRHRSSSVSVDSAAGSVLRNTECEESGPSSSKPKKRGHEDQNNTQVSLTHCDSVSKLARRQKEEESTNLEEAGASNTDVRLNSMEGKQGQEDTLQNEENPGEVLENKGISVCDKGVQDSGTSEDVCISKQNRGTCDSAAVVDATLKTSHGDPPLVDVRMIDFAHVFPATDTDSNYLFGLHRLIGLLEQLLDL